MVSQRQRSARKRFKKEHSELFPKSEPPAPKDPNKKKIKSNKFKRKKSDLNGPNKRRISSFKKHPLRIAGMKPGESCFICKAADHIAKNCPKKSEWERNKICLFCRQRGHSLKHCANKNDDSADQKFCYNCGESGHSLAKCPQPIQDGGTTYANCFICNETGHLSKNCPKNTHGIYLKGGGCKICGGVTHLARDCPNKQSRTSEAAIIRQSLEAKPNRVTKLVSGDDLEDDFVPVVVPREGEGKDVKIKKKHGTKVVNFLG